MYCKGVIILSTLLLIGRAYGDKTPETRQGNGFYIPAEAQGPGYTPVQQTSYVNAPQYSASNQIVQPLSTQYNQVPAQQPQYNQVPYNPYGQQQPGYVPRPVYTTPRPVYVNRPQPPIYAPPRPVYVPQPVYVPRPQPPRYAPTRPQRQQNPLELIILLQLLQGGGLFGSKSTTDKFKDWEEVDGCKYMHFTTTKSWSDAHASCRNKGAKLIHEGIRAENLPDILTGLGFTAITEPNFWVGLTYDTTNAIWEYVNDASITQTVGMDPWNTDEPDDGDTTQGCASYNAMPKKLQSDACSELKSYICEAC